MTSEIATKKKKKNLLSAMVIAEKNSIILF